VSQKQKGADQRVSPICLWSRIVKPTWEGAIQGH